MLYLLILWCLRGKRTKMGLALAIGTGSLGLILPVAEFLSSEALPPLVLSGLGIYAVAQSVVIASAIKTYYTMNREPSDKRTLGLGVAAAVLVWIVGILWFDGL